jgi:hypothetical protein
LIQEQAHASASVQMRQQLEVTITLQGGARGSGQETARGVRLTELLLVGRRRGLVNRSLSSQMSPLPQRSGSGERGCIHSRAPPPPILPAGAGWVPGPASNTKTDCARGRPRNGCRLLPLECANGGSLACAARVTVVGATVAVGRFTRVRTVTSKRTPT